MKQDPNEPRAEEPPEESPQKPTHSMATPRDNLDSSNTIPAILSRARSSETVDQALWIAIRNQTTAISFNRYSEFIDKVLCNKDGELDRRQFGANNDILRMQHQDKEHHAPAHALGAYELLKIATQVFLLLESGTAIQHGGRYSSKTRDDRRDVTPADSMPVSLETIQHLLRNCLGDTQVPYIQTVLRNAFQGFRSTDKIVCSGYLVQRADSPALIELIWSYWHEEAMLVQTMNAIGLRFQNRPSSAGPDPLADIEIAPLHPINNLLWGYIQDEPHRLSVPRRAYEYDHHYGLTLSGNANADFRSTETRSQFLEAFQRLLYRCTGFFKQEDETTLNSDGFPVLNALKEVHLLLAEGAHNQFGDLPWTAKAEMLTEQWILSRPEMNQFLQSQHMVPYREVWMGQVEAMKRLQGWTDVSITHFSELAIYGEQILLSIRFGSWNLINNPAQAATWARYWRSEIQNYIHSYRAVTGVDLQVDQDRT